MTQTPTTAQMPAEQAMRRAVTARDDSYDGQFVYGVLSTGIYCRPSCASRRPKPQNIRFFADTPAAAAAGLRPCKRCRPDSSVDRAGERMRSLAAYIEAHADEPLSLKKLSERAHLSPTHLQRAFKSVLGMSPKAFHDAARMGAFKTQLKSGKSVLDSIAGAGFQSTSRVYERAFRHLGMTPSAYRAGGEGETIAYAYRRSTVGPLLMAATDRGVCFAQFGESEASLARQLQGEFPRARIVRSDMTHSRELDAWIHNMDVYLTGRAPRPSLPLDLRGTAFQILVWQYLLSVPEGEVRSYQEVAAGIGSPRAARAAAAACAANRIAVLVPCHRVLRADGSMGGYRWGLARKRGLLSRERQM